MIQFRLRYSLLRINWEIKRQKRWVSSTNQLWVVGVLVRVGSEIRDIWLLFGIAHSIANFLYDLQNEFLWHQKCVFCVFCPNMFLIFGRKGRKSWAKLWLHCWDNLLIRGNFWVFWVLSRCSASITDASEWRGKKANEFCYNQAKKFHIRQNDTMPNFYGGL